MKHIKIISVGLGLLAAGTTWAQTTTSSTPTGLLGQRYGELSAGLHDVHNLSDNAYTVGASVNLPVAPFFDAGVSYNYDWIRGAFPGHANTGSTYLVAYKPMQGVKPFVGAALGWQWSRSGLFAGDAHGVWGATAGVEIPVGEITLTPRVSYADDFEATNVSAQQWSWGIEANYWATARTAFFGSIGRSDVMHSPVRSWDYQFGMRVKF